MGRQGLPLVWSKSLSVAISFVTKDRGGERERDIEQITSMTHASREMGQAQWPWGFKYGRKVDVAQPSLVLKV